MSYQSLCTVGHCCRPTCGVTSCTHHGSPHHHAMHHAINRLRSQDVTFRAVWEPTHVCQHTPLLFAWVINPNANNAETTAETKHTEQADSNIQYPNWGSIVSARTEKQQRYHPTSSVLGNNLHMSNLHHLWQAPAPHIKQSHPHRHETALTTVNSLLQLLFCWDTAYHQATCFSLQGPALSYQATCLYLQDPAL
jgi:hypothetical protein